METTEIVMENERKYKVILSPDMPAGAYIVVGPPEGLIDALGLPEPFATRLHNALYDRGIFTAKDAQKKSRDVTGALQEALMVDVQRLTEEFFKYEKETV